MLSPSDSSCVGGIGRDGTIFTKILITIYISLVQNSKLQNNIFKDLTYLRNINLMIINLNLD